MDLIIITDKNLPMTPQTLKEQCDEIIEDIGAPIFHIIKYLFLHKNMVDPKSKYLSNYHFEKLKIFFKHYNFVKKKQ